MTLRRAVLTWTLGLGALGCAAVQPPRIGDAPPEVADAQLERSYRDTVARFTAHQELYSGFDTRMFAAATFESYAQREAEARRKGAFEALPADAIEALVTASHQKFSESVDFLFGVSVVDYHFDDFDRHDSQWQIHLVTESGEVVPTSVERVGRATLNLRAYYPYLGDFWVAYRIHFPQRFADGRPVLTGAGQTVMLRLGSTYGRVELKLPTQ